MPTPTSSKIIRDHGQLSAVAALGFQVIGWACLLTSLLILLAFPEVLSGDPYRTEVLALAALIVPGFVASFIFGSFYAVASLLSGSGLWSRRLAMAHLGVHGIGMAWLVAAFAGMPFLQSPYVGMAIGGAILIGGILMLTVNLLLTAAKSNRWEPAQLTVVVALFWLLLAGVLAVARVVDGLAQLLPSTMVARFDAFLLLGLAGFLWLGLWGAILKMFSMFAVGSHAPGVSSWLGLVIINAALLLAVPVIAGQGAFPVGILALLVLVGSLGYMLDLGRMVVTARKRLDGGLGTALAGLLGGLGVLLWLALGQPTTLPAESAAGREGLRAAIALLVFGAVLLVALGSGLRLVPFLVWRIRCAPWIGFAGLPEVGDLASARFRPVVAICLVLGALYVFAGQLLGNAAGTQLGMLCLLVGAAWFFRALAPSARIFVLGFQPPEGVRSPYRNAEKRTLS